jgi:hypothetical protein
MCKLFVSNRKIKDKDKLYYERKEMKEKAIELDDRSCFAVKIDAPENYVFCCCGKSTCTQALVTL